MHNSQNRFSSRVANYVKYRPTYPRAFVEHLLGLGILSGSHHVADIGSGSGLSSLPLLEIGCTVMGIEPNAAMREAGADFLTHHEKFQSIAGTAESTHLPDNSIDFIVAGQAFHWFDRQQCRKEFARILRPGGHVLLMWNGRLTDSTPFLQDYETLLLKHGTDYSEINHVNITPEVIAEFFAPMPVQFHEFDNHQRVDYDGLEGRLMSSSYVPNYGEPGNGDMLQAAQQLFNEHVSEGEVEFVYKVRMHYGRLS